MKKKIDGFHQFLANKNVLEYQNWAFFTFNLKAGSLYYDDTADKNILQKMQQLLPAWFVK